MDHLMCKLTGLLSYYCLGKKIKLGYFVYLTDWFHYMIIAVMSDFVKSYDLDVLNFILRYITAIYLPHNSVTQIVLKY